MSSVFGLSPSDIIKLVEYSTRIYVAFKDANESSEAQVQGLVREFSTFHHCLVELDDLMKEYGKPLPFPYLQFEETLQRCQETLKPYANHLVDNKKMTFKRFSYTIKYIGKEREMDGLRKQITGHCQAIQMCISFLQLRLHLEATKQTQRLLDWAPFRSLSFGGHMYSNNAFASSSRPIPNALPAPAEADQLYKDWQVFDRWFKNEDERLAREGGSIGRPRSFGDTPASQGGDQETAAMLYHLRRELEDAIKVEENRAKRAAVEQRSQLSPSDAIREEIRTMPPVPLRTYTLDTDHSCNFSGFNNNNSALKDSTAAIQPHLATSLPTISLAESPQIPPSDFRPVEWGSISPEETQGTPSVSTIGTCSSTSPEFRHSLVNTAGTTPEEHPLRAKLSISSLVTIALGKGSLEWTQLCRKVEVERTTCNGVESRQCDIHWRYREDAGLSIRSVYRDESTKKPQIWIVQHFPATGPSIPLTTSHSDGDISVEFPRRSFGKLEKRCTDIKYTFANSESSYALQTLLYTNNGSDKADLLFDRQVKEISSDKNKAECRGKNLRLWRQTEMQNGIHGVTSIDVLVLLFYTSFLREDRAHWVEEPHYAFEPLDDSVYEKPCEKVVLLFSKEARRLRKRYVTNREKDSKETANHEDNVLNSLPALCRRGTISSVRSSTASMRSANFGFENRQNSVNRFGYSELQIRFQSQKDQKDFLDVWRRYLKQSGVGNAS
ncbi:hypothetical protein GQ43DRAFT_374804 [Delitschia confertaspora ATCC 74209]|uniref:Uncharacterized protein n=1 Tax=Delitschia confertaspora ATCC 74209 TaxID=1513339 RepID=A0A9P4JKU9_9PLEO|nr:hypothetical protein GQ43DRAFT_374804 [Delitschia confertaspora ATCC 74209]